MKLFHSFPRPRESSEISGNTLEVDTRTQFVAEVILAAVLNYGVLCAPEKLPIFPDPATQNRLKLPLLREGKPEYTQIQSRFCLTLCTEKELFERKIRGIVPGTERPLPGKDSRLSHAELFGPYAIGFEPVASRQLGIVPTNYYAPTDIFGHRYETGATDTPGLNLQMIQRLKELRELMIVLAMIERSLTVEGGPLPGDEIIRALNLDIPYQPDVKRRIYNLSEKERRGVFELFNTDRDVALNLVSFIEMMLNLFQETDSSIDGSVLAFYQQREWRLIHHMREGMVWYCLGSQPFFRNPLAEEKRKEIRQLRQRIEAIAGKPYQEGYFQNCWILEQVEGRPIRDWITSIIVPSRGLSAARKIVQSAGSLAAVVAAEDFGYRA